MFMEMREGRSDECSELSVRAIRCYRVGDGVLFAWVGVCAVGVGRWRNEMHRKNGLASGHQLFFLSHQLSKVLVTNRLEIRL